MISANAQIYCVRWSARKQLLLLPLLLMMMMNANDSVCTIRQLRSTHRACPPNAILQRPRCGGRRLAINAPPLRPIWPHKQTVCVFYSRKLDLNKRDYWNSHWHWIIQPRDWNCQQQRNTLWLLSVVRRLFVYCLHGVHGVIQQHKCFFSTHPPSTNIIAYMFTLNKCS